MASRLFLSMFMIVVVGLPLSACATDQVHKDTADSFIVQINEDAALCGDFLKVLESPENSGFIIPGEELLKLSPEAADQRSRDRREIVFPDKIQNFKSMIWEEITDQEEYRRLSDFIDKSDKEGHNYQYILEHKMDYTPKKTKVDIDKDGVENTIYLARLGLYPRLIASDEDPLIRERLRGIGYIGLFLYKNEPYFTITNDRRMVSIAIGKPITARFLSVSDRKSYQDFGMKTTCQYKIKDKTGIK